MRRLLGHFPNINQIVQPMQNHVPSAGLHGTDGKHVTINDRAVRLEVVALADRANAGNIVRSRHAFGHLEYREHELKCLISPLQMIARMAAHYPLRGMINYCGEKLDDLVCCRHRVTLSFRSCRTNHRIT